MNRRYRAPATTTRRVLAVGTAAVTSILLTATLAAGEPSSLTLATRATAAYQDLDVAISAGYDFELPEADGSGNTCIADTRVPSRGTMGVHFVNLGLVGDPEVSGTTPEVLVYEPAGDGSMRLVALEYVVFKTDWDATHNHPPKLFGRRFHETPAGNRYGLPAFYALHAWVWQDNPNGMFADWNPLVQCP